MPRYKQLREDLKNAQLNKETDKVGTIRYVLSELNNYAIEQKKNAEDLEDAEVEQVLTKMGKQREESIEAFKEGGRTDLVNKEQEELDLINTYLPDQLDEQETEKAVEDMMDEMDIKSISQMGTLMTELKEKYGASINMRKASRVVKEKLS